MNEGRNEQMAVVAQRNWKNWAHERGAEDGRMKLSRKIEEMIGGAVVEKRVRAEKLE